MNPQRPQKVTQGELDKRLQQHKLWMGDHAQGKQADFSGEDLSALSVRRADLCSVKMNGTNLEGADLREAVLREADLRHAKLTGARLEGADLGGARLDGAILTDTDIHPNQLAGVRLRGATLPEQLVEFKALEEIESLTETLEKLWLLILVVCGYALLTIFITSDVTLLPNVPSKVFHGLSVPVPTAGLYVAGPLVLLVLVGVFYRYLAYLWDRIAGLPEELPDGRRRSNAVHPWIVSCEIMKVCAQLRPLAPFSSFVALVVWWIVPVVLVLSWLRYLPRHDWTGTLIQIAAVLISLVLSDRAHSQAKRVLRGDLALRQSSPYDRRLLATLVIGAGMFLLSYGVIQGIPADWREPESFRLVTNCSPAGEKQCQEVDARVNDPAPTLRFLNPRTWAPRLFSFAGASAFADVSNQSLSSQELGDAPSAGQKFPSARGVNLRGRQMRYLRAVKSSFLCANLERAVLRGGRLIESDFRFSELAYADLCRCWAKGADFSGADCEYTDFSGALLESANFEGTTLLHTKMTNAVLQAARFKGAIVNDVGMPAANLQKADLSGATLVSVNGEGASFIGCNLTNTTFLDSYLKCAKLSGALFHNTKFVRCDLCGVNLSAEEELHIVRE